MCGPRELKTKLALLPGRFQYYMFSSHSSTWQSKASMSSWMLKRADSTSLRGRYAAPRCNTSSSSKRCTWLIYHESRPSGISTAYPLRKPTVVSQLFFNSSCSYASILYVPATLNSSLGDAYLFVITWHDICMNLHSGLEWNQPHILVSLYHSVDFSYSCHLVLKKKISRDVYLL